MVVEDIDPDHGLVELRVGALDQLVIQVLLVVEGVEALEDEIEGVEVLRAGRGDEDVGVAEAHSGGDGQPEGSGLAPASGGREGHRTAEGLLGDRLHKLQQGLGLVQSPDEGQKLAMQLFSTILAVTTLHTTCLIVAVEIFTLSLKGLRAILLGEKKRKKKLTNF